ncbi:Thiamine biosynthesis lipoprotein ApbE precursor [Bremerella volcania]|uniref:FAD:protein FMN transferase n=1 Tax=Bremerella volcania TaxID=2527984 RepID=A0A518CAS9_9BACT|nr:DUF2271 domain-containing protein [Bremerella volcania]QDU76339.1 Thiamine biosynthesis lipoprotein ApbE precursor [Bremerella volcania]
MKLRIWNLVFLALLATTAVPLMADDFHFHHEHVLGTSLHLAISCEDKARASIIERSVLQEIDRLDGVLSRWDDQSEFMAWQAGHTTLVSEDLATVLQRADYWRNATRHAFDVRAEAISSMWRDAAKNGHAPTDTQRRQLAAKLEAAPYACTSDGSIGRGDDLVVSLDGLAKGYILDRVCDLVQREYPETRDFLINIGGDLRKLGDQPLEIAIENPRDASEGVQPLQTFVVAQPIAIATSGSYRRYQTLGDRRVSHILDPRTCLPAELTQSVTVVSTLAIDADALATSVSVLGPVDGLALIESLEDTECCLVTASGKLVTSSGWPLGTGEANSLKLVANEDAPKAEHGLFVDFTIQRAEGGRYRRPYVAMWLEDAEGFPVKTEILWMQTEQPGPRWHRDLTRWYRNDRLRKTVENIDLIDTISGVTRGPGEYKAHFDGTDNLDLPLAAGKYTLCLEVAREHGTYQIIRETFEWGDKPIAEKKLKGNVEVGSMSYRFVPLAATDKEAP